MGIHKLTEVIRDKAPGAVKKEKVSRYRGWKVAIDASVLIYQTLTAVRYEKELVNAEGESTSHIYGILYKAVNMLEKGIIPVFVFDGIPPDMKKEVLAKRKERKENAERLLAVATTAEDIARLSKQTVRATLYHIETAIEMLRHLGIPCISSPGEAEAYCVALQRAKLVDAIVTEDMDVLAFGGEVLLRSFITALVKNADVIEIRLSKVLKEMKISYEEFVDMCILLGCDYCESPKGVGPKKAYEVIQECRSIEAAIDTRKISPPENWLYKEARELFLYRDHDIPVKPFTLGKISKDNLYAFLVEKHSFDKKKVENVLVRLDKISSMRNQGSLAGFIRK